MPGSDDVDTDLPNAGHCLTDRSSADDFDRDFDQKAVPKLQTPSRKHES